jgi:hypothetical protein
MGAWWLAWTATSVPDRLPAPLLPLPSLQVGAVVVGFDRNINYYKIQMATLCIRENPGCMFIATNTGGWVGWAGLGMGGLGRQGPTNIRLVCVAGGAVARQLHTGEACRHAAAAVHGMPELPAICLFTSSRPYPACCRSSCSLLQML